jgi:hypothetical protein
MTMMMMKISSVPFPFLFRRLPIHFHRLSQLVTHSFFNHRTFSCSEWPRALLLSKQDPTDCRGGAIKDVRARERRDRLGPGDLSRGPGVKTKEVAG